MPTPLQLATALIGIQAAFAAYTGYLGFARPERLATMLGLELQGPSGANEMRSQYGGFFTAMAITQLISVVGTVPLEVGLIVGMMVFGGLSMGRLWSVLSGDALRSYTPTIRSLVFLDPLGFVLSMGAFLAIS
jgi:hypothetical protein